MLRGWLILVYAISAIAAHRLNTEERARRLLDENVEDPFVIGFSPDLSHKYSPGIAQADEPTLYIKKKEEKFSRSSVEAAPDSLPGASFTLAGHRASLPLTRSSLGVSPFYRGNIESGALHYQGPAPYSQRTAESAPLQYYGAAKWQNAEPVVSAVPHSLKPEEVQGYYYGAAKEIYGNRFAPLPTGQVFNPLRESVEARPDLANQDQPLIEQARFLDIDFDEKKDMSDLKSYYLLEHNKRFRQARPHGHSWAQGRLAEERLGNNNKILYAAPFNHYFQ